MPEMHKSGTSKRNTTLLNIIKVMSSNIMTVLVGIVVGFVIPKIFSLTDYGYYKQFNLYCSYIGLFSMGVADGIVLRYGDYNLDMLNKKKFRSYFLCFLLLQTFFCIVLIVQSLLYINSNDRFVFIAFGINIIAMNLTGYFQQISQITQRFNEYTIRNILKSTLTVASVAVVFFVYKCTNTASYKLYIILLLICNYALTIWYMSTYRNLIFGDREHKKVVLHEMWGLVKFGFPLMCANLCSTLILALDRQFVSTLFTTEVYAVYAFAYNLLSLVTVATSACGVVLYPVLKRTTIATLKETYAKLVTIVLVFSFIAMGVYYPLCSFIKWYLPNYVDSLFILRIIFPGLAATACITVVIHNYYKTLNISNLFFKRSLLILAISFVGNVFAYYITHETYAISVASIATMVIWFVQVNWHMRKQYGCPIFKNIIYLLIMMSIFYLVSEIEINWIGLIIYELLALIISFFMHKSFVVSIYKKIRR